MSDQEYAVNRWLLNEFPKHRVQLTPLHGDASFRRYFRAQVQDNTYIVMSAPPDKEPLDPFLEINARLHHHGLQTPQVHRMNKAEGYLLLDDFGDTLLLHALNQSTAHSLYTQAMDTLLQIQTCPTQGLIPFDTDAMMKELDLFKTWFLEAYLKLSLSSREKSWLDEVFFFIASECQKQPQVFIHRDYHSRNLMILKNKPLGVIDFQDARLGPFTYDLVSLLKDCYIQWDSEQILIWLQYFYTRSPFHASWTFEAYLQAFGLSGLQRHLKVLGIFSRLYLRDGKGQYLHDLPLTFHYILTYLETNSELESLYRFIQSRVTLPCIA